MLTLFYSNRYEALTEALLDRLAQRLPDPWQAESIIVPSAALRRRLELDLARCFGICANVDFTYLAQWLWQQAGRLLTLPEQVRYDKEQLVWRCYRLLDPQDKRWAQDERLGVYLHAADDIMRYELAQRVAALFDQYLTYRPDWLAAWQEGRLLLSPTEQPQQIAPSTLLANQTQRSDERWQAELWRCLSAEMTTLNESEAAPALSIQYFLTELRAQATRLKSAPSAWPQRVSVFALPTIAPLHLAVLQELANWIEVNLYLLNPCREYWYDIVPTARVAELGLTQQMDYQEIGNPLLAEWGRQTQAELQVLQEMTQDTPVIETAKYLENPTPTWLATVQNAILNLQAQPVLKEPLHDVVPENRQCLSKPEAAKNDEDTASIEVHVCHSLARQLEVLHDRLLALFNRKNSEQPALEPTEVLVAFPDLAAAAPLIEAVFGNLAGTTPTSQRIPYRITGLPPSRINPIAQTLDSMLTLSEREVVLTDVLEWLHVDALAARYEIEATELETVETWLRAAGARHGFAADAELREQGASPEISLQNSNIGWGETRTPTLPPFEHLPNRPRHMLGFVPHPNLRGSLHSPNESENSGASAPELRQRCSHRHTLADALMRLYLGYALPAGALPVGAWLPVAGAGSQAELLGRLSRLVDDLDEFAQACAVARSAEAWRILLKAALERFFSMQAPHTQQVMQVQQAVSQLAEVITAAAPDTLIPAAVIRRALRTALDAAAPGGVPSGGVTFAAFSSLRSLPYRVICLLGLEQGVLPSVARADEFDLIAAFGRLGDRQRRDDERNLFLDLLLAAREHFLLAYTGRSLRDNAPLPPAAPVDELLDYLSQAYAGPDAAPAELRAARQHFIIEHPLQPFASDYFVSGEEHDNRLFTYDKSRAEIAATLASSATRRMQLASFFTEPLAVPEASELAFTEFAQFWRHPARALVRGRLGAALSYPALAQVDTEPFEFDWQARDALATRLLPILLTSIGWGDAGTPTCSLNRNENALMQHPDGGEKSKPEIGQTQQELTEKKQLHGPSEETLPAALLERAARIARASPELPGGALGEIWRTQELSTLTQFAARVRSAVNESRPLPFSLTLKPQWPQALTVPEGYAALADIPVTLHGTLSTLTAQGLVLYRYARPNARDYLQAWLHHLVLCLAAPAEMVPRTLWLGQTETFSFTTVIEAEHYLQQLIALYQIGLCEPLHFFPKSAWAAVTEGEAVAARVWLGSQQTTGEAQDPYWRAALRTSSKEAVLDANFMTLARSVFEPLQAHLEIIE